MRTEDIDARPGWRDDLDVSLRRLRAAIVGGFLAGVLVGGVGGRIAMLILRLTSTPAVRGLESDDGFVIGQISAATVFLLILTGVLGAAGGLVYLAVRNWIPPRWRVAAAAVMAGALGGLAVIDPVGLDFTVLGPLSLAVAMFVVLPAAYGALMSVWVERRLGAEQPPSNVAVWVPCVLFALAIALTGPIGVAILTAAAIAWILHRRVPALGGVWTSEPVVWLGRALLVAVTGVAAFRLVGEAVDIL
jgi:hypothetical protein